MCGRPARRVASGAAARHRARDAHDRRISVWFAERLGVSRLSVSELLLEKRALSPEMAARVAKLLRTTPESWLRMQEAVDLWELAQHPERFADVKPIDKRLLQAA